ncbi:hypothetical protein EUZ85_26405 [Hahella sp. KA22]|uniref:hypothetical protein n=1 Tax=Hahella sp. KA22 TaxID=1628392 RepID=UPI000FDD486E|nr:hypothetical protein [Hahella sp. KA22]AZZ94059.1 hypothetical protein ENC22_23820 [Hahella sp. KA22]QAY57433.1 hypothetical protein EUZ85_26405 [Hahella sp. KA22]
MNQAVNMTAQRIGQPGTGKKVMVSAQLVSTYNKLIDLSKKGDYWATYIVKEIGQLTSGVSRGKSVYVHEDFSIAGYKLYRMMLPGCVANIVETPSREYQIEALDIDFSFFEKQVDFKKPGLLFAKPKRTGGWNVSLIMDKEVRGTDGKAGRTGYVKPQSKNKEDWIIVGVADLNPSPHDAAREVAAHISASHFKSEISKLGFNLMYTPGEGSVGGWRLAEANNAQKSERIHESAQVLADVMVKAQKQRKPVAWVTQYGGSGVFTQALQIVRDRGVRLDSHTAFLSGATTNTDRAFVLCRDLGMHVSPDDSFAKNQVLSVRQALGGMALGWAPVKTMVRRLRSQKGYGLKQVTSDALGLFTNGKDVQGIGTAVTTMVAAFGAGPLYGVCGAIAASAPVISAVATNIPAFDRYPNLQAAIQNTDRKLW